MAIPSVYAPVKRGDFTLRPFVVHREYVLSHATLLNTGSGYNLVDGIHTSLKTPIGSSKADNDPTNTFDNSYQHVVWQAYNHLYYKYPYDTMATFEHANRRYTFKFLNYSASIFSAPYMDVGERMKAGSVIVSNSSHAFTLQDDGNGNLYDPAIATGSFSKPYAIVGYWGFNETFRKFNYREGTASGDVGYVSRTFEPDDNSIVKNVTFDVGVKINSTGSGMQANFDGTSYIMTHDRPQFNFASNEDFTIAFWVEAPVSQSNESNTTNSLISKRGVIRKSVYGVNDKIVNDMVIATKHVSQSLADDATDVYPYDFDFYNSTTADSGKVRFRRSDGINVHSLTSTTDIADGAAHHVTVTRSGSLLTLYVDGSSEATDTDNTTNPLNKHSILFGASNRAFDQGFSGSLDEIRMYDYAADSATIATLADNTTTAMYQTAVAGNVFYRQGNIVISALDPKYQNALKDNWFVFYDNTHTIYQYEAFCRVKKGSFNLTMNPTARQSPKSDLLINDMTGSLLMPYATTIGLYNSDGELVAIGKLGQAVKMRDDVDITFLVRWDA